MNYVLYLYSTLCTKVFYILGIFSFFAVWILDPKFKKVEEFYLPKFNTVGAGVWWGQNDFGNDFFLV